jgi:hypothetical protein
MNQPQKPCVSTLSGLAEMLHGQCRLVSPFKKDLHSDCIICIIGPDSRGRDPPWGYTLIRQD